MSRVCRVSHSTIQRRLKMKMKMKFMKIITVPHVHNVDEKLKRVELSQELLKQLDSLSHIDVITSDESWFYFCYSGSSMWVRDKNDVEIVEKRQIFTHKVMISIFWNFYLFYIEWVPEKDTFNSNFIVETLFPQLEQVARIHRPSKGLKSFALHWDNAKPHTSIKTMTSINSLFRCCLSHPPHSPDLAPSDFFVFGYLKNGLVGKKIIDVEDLKNEITISFRGILRQTKMNVFIEWKERLKRVVSNNGIY